MRPRLIDALVHLLPLEPRAARAIDETLRDWDHEVAAASTAAGRAGAHLRGGMAWLSTLLRVGIADLRGMPSFGFLARVAVVILPVSLLLAERMSAVRRLPSAELGAQIAAYVLPGLAVVWLPIALLVAIVWQGRNRPVQLLGTLLVSVAISAVAQGTVIPLSNQAYRVRVAAVLHSPAPAAGLHEWTIGDLARAVGRVPDLQSLKPMLRSFAERLTLVIWTGTCVWLGVAMARTRRRWRWIAAYIAIAIVLITIALAVRLPASVAFLIVALEPLALLGRVGRAADADVLAAP